MSSPRGPVPLDPLIGALVDGRYRVEARVGGGGMGTVYRARREGLDRPVALKVLHPAVATDETVRRRFAREAQSASRLDHPGCVRVSDHGVSADGLCYLAMELIEGPSLATRLGRPLAPAVAADLAAQILDALDHAHERGIVHRDLKPENILAAHDASGRERLKLVDFGIAKILQGKETEERLTRTGFVYGTPHYMSPEQAAGGEIDHRADLYAAGLILYEMLAGRRAFSALDPVALMRKQVTQEPDPLPAEVPGPLAQLVQRLLAKDPARRFPGARAALDALTAVRPALSDLPAARLGPGPSDAARATTRADPRPAAPPTTIVDPASPSPTSARSGSARRARTRGRFAAAAVASAAAGAAAVLAWRDHPPSVDEARDAGAEPSPAAGPASHGTGEPAETGAGSLDPEVTITIRANVDAEVIGEQDGRVLGRTGEPGFSVARSRLPLRVLLRAEGYEDRALQVVPSRDKTFEQELRRKRPRRGIDGLHNPWGEAEDAPPEGALEPGPPELESAPAPETEEKEAPRPTLEDPFSRTRE